MSARFCLLRSKAVVLYKADLIVCNAENLLDLFVGNIKSKSRLDFKALISCRFVIGGGGLRL